MGLATQVRPNIYRVSNAGHSLLGEIMRRNGERARAWSERGRA